ncbi:MAG: hypothetical protein WB995_06660 [Candidatus Acidiferrales bacterium]
MHSGWGALVAVTNSAGKIEVIERRRIEFITPTVAGAKQPYHFAANLELPEAEKFIAKCFAAPKSLAAQAIRELLAELSARQFRVAGAAVVLASGRPLPPLEKILVAHPLLHTAEGQFFREAFAKACDSLALPVTGVRERDLEAQLQQTFGKAAAKLHRQISNAGRVLGPPWTQDQKSAALAALTLLAK